MSAAAMRVLLRQSEKQEAVPLGAGDLLRNGTQRIVASVAILEAVVNDLHDDALILELLHNQPPGIFRRES